MALQKVIKSDLVMRIVIVMLMMLLDTLLTCLPKISCIHCHRSLSTSIIKITLFFITTMLVTLALASLVFHIYIKNSIVNKTPFFMMTMLVTLALASHIHNVNMMMFASISIVNMSWRLSTCQSALSLCHNDLSHLGSRLPGGLCLCRHRPHQLGGHPHVLHLVPWWFQ